MGKTARVCNKQGCVELVIGATYCAQHKLNGWSTTTWKRPPGWEKLRQSVMHRDNKTCVYCGDPATEIDHVIPVSKGGSNRTSNLVASCKSCNAKKNIAQRRT